MGKKSKTFAVLGVAALLAIGAGAPASAQEPAAQASVPAPEASAEEPRAAKSITILRALDKITARISELEAPDNEPIRFGSLSIQARTCRSEPPEEKPETYAFLEIDDIDKSGAATRVFSGWMLASSPALNPLEHPVYDVWVISCRIPEEGVS